MSGFSIALPPFSGRAYLMETKTETLCEKKEKKDVQDIPARVLLSRNMPNQEKQEGTMT
jgi:hypothetical protein